MGDATELLLTSDASSGTSSASVWDWKVGTSLHYYKNGGILHPQTGTFLGQDYFLAAERSKPLIHVWPLNSQEPGRNNRVVCPGPVSALICSPDGRYLAAGIGEQLHLWQTSSGQLLALATKHFQGITKLQFSSDGSYLVSVGEDALVLIWGLSRLLSSADREPLHTLSDHSLPVTDMCITQSDTQLITVSSDCTVKIHKMCSGQLLLSVVFDESLTAVAAAIWGPRAFIGTVSGDIHELKLHEPPRNTLHHVESNSDMVKFSGHTKSVSALSISADGLTLASGSLDNQLILWHIPTRQKLRTIPHSAALTHVSFIRAAKNMFREDFKPSVSFGSLQRNVVVENQFKGPIHILHTEDLTLPFEETVMLQETPGISGVPDTANSQSQIQSLRLINAQLYQYCLDSILTKNSNNVDAELFDAVKPNKKKRKCV